MDRLVILIVFFSFSHVHAQSFSISEIRMRQGFDSGTDSLIIYPIIKTSKASVDKIINDRIASQILSPYGDDTLDLRSALRTSIEGGLSSLYYEIAYRKNEILSLIINGEGCGAYCTPWKVYFNFDLRTGGELKIGDVIRESKLDSFRQIVFNDKRGALQLYKAEEKSLLEQKEIDSSTYDWVMERVENCIVNVNLNEFSLSPLGIEIIDNCDMPHAIQSQTPSYKLSYTFQGITAFLKPEFRRRLSLDAKSSN